MREIYDEYMRDFERQKADEAGRQKASAKKVAQQHPAGGPTVGAAAAASTADTAGGSDAGGQLAAPSMSTALQIMDRMINQNKYAGVAMDFKYWEDPTDSFRWAPGLGRLLLLLLQCCCCPCVQRQLM
jgi:dynein intermediate chain 1